MIVVVDDYKDSADVLVRLLQRNGREAIALTCGDDLFAYLTHSRPELIVLDMMMPGMDGLACLQRLASDGNWRDIPVVVYSADFTHEMMRRALGAGARDFVVKATVPWTELLTIIGKHLPVN